MWQTGSSSYLWSAIVGPAGRRREASFSGGLARSLAQGGQCLSDVAGGRTGAACLREGEIWVGEVTAAWGSAGDVEKSEGTDERASQGKCRVQKNEGTAMPGTAWHRGCGEPPARSHRLEMKGPGGVVILREERVTRLCRAGSRFTF